MTHTDAAVTRAEAVWNANQVHELGKVPSTPVTPYMVLSVSGGAAAAQRSDGTHGAKAHRIVVQCVGKTAYEVGTALDKADAAFADHALVIDGYDTTRAIAELEANITRDPDGGALLTVTQTYSFTAYPTE